MNFKNGSSRTLISIALTSAYAVGFSGCVPVTPTAKLALYYQVSQAPGTEKSWIKRWDPATSKTDVIFQQQTDGSGLNTQFVTGVQPKGSILTLLRFGFPTISNSLLTPDGPSPQLRLLYDTTGVDDSTQIGGMWNEWAPDGKHIALQIDDNIIVQSPDGNIKITYAKVDFENPINTSHAWSPDGSRLAYTRSENSLEVVNVYTGAKTNFSIAEANGTSLGGPTWMADNRHIVVGTYDGNESHWLIFDMQNPASSQPAFTNASQSVFYNGVPSPDGDRVVQTNYSYGDPTADYVLVFADNRANVALSTVAVAEGDDANQLLPSWSHDGERLAYIKDVDNDGDIDVVIASKEGAVQKTFTDFGQVGDASLAWSPDDSKLVVITNVVASHGGTTEGKLITLASSAIDNLFETAAPSNQVVEWSPNSRYVVIGQLLFDAKNPAIAATQLPSVYQVAWAFDSSYLGISSNEELGAPCTISVIKLANSNRAITPVAQNTSCSVFWSNTGSN
jgi:Tol biopolymer transport system component